MRRAIVIAAVMVAGSAGADPYPQHPLSYIMGTVDNIYDADTFHVCDSLTCYKIRLRGVAAPEVRGEEREDGLKARDWVRGEWQGRLVMCAVLGASHDRLVADCYGLTSMGADVVASGLARACPAFGGGYEDAPGADRLPLPEYCR